MRKNLNEDWLAHSKSNQTNYSYWSILLATSGLNVNLTCLNSTVIAQWTTRSSQLRKTNSVKSYSLQLKLRFNSFLMTGRGLYLGSKPLK